MNKICTSFFAIATASAVALASSAAFAGGFQLRETSAAAQGASFAGSSAGGGDVTYASYNPAALKVVDGMEVGASVSYLALGAEITETATGDTDDGGTQNLLGANTFGYRLNDKVVLGMSVSAPFGLSTDYDDNGFVRYDSTETILKTYAVTPMISYQVSPTFTIGAGVTMMYGDLELESRIDTDPTSDDSSSDLKQRVEAEGIAFSFQAGMIWEVSPAITLGVSYRSKVDFSGDTDVTVKSTANGATVQAFGATASADLPAVLSFGLRADITDKTTLLGEAQWTGWSVLDVFRLSLDSGGTEDEVYGYKDSWYFALGLEHRFNDKLTLRSGIGYDNTPTTDEDRSSSVPDSNRILLSIGGSYRMSEKMKLDLAYTYIFGVEDAKMDIDTDVNVGETEATAKGTVHLLSIGASYEF